MALVGEALLSGSIQVMCEKIASGEFVDFFRARRLNHSLMDKLKVTLNTLQGVLNDAEEKQIVNPAVGEWLNDVKDAVFDAEDLVDEIDTEALRHKAKDQTKKTQVLNFLSTSLNPFNYKGWNGRIEKLFQRLEYLAKQRNRLGLREGIGRMVSQRTPTTSVVEEGFCPYGRDKDQEKLKKLLLLSDNGSSSNFSVVPVVGMGGVGKTTLAHSWIHLCLTDLLHHPCGPYSSLTKPRSENHLDRVRLPLKSCKPAFVLFRTTHLLSAP